MEEEKAVDLTEYFRHAIEKGHHFGVVPVFGECLLRFMLKESDGFHEVWIGEIPRQRFVVFDLFEKVVRQPAVCNQSFTPFLAVKE